uniref:BED-type domain-containing protein n=1 Tax=Cannabis sativa TaxID=3483 RepID=A0A803Q018_CANSA
MELDRENETVPSSQPPQQPTDDDGGSKKRKAAKPPRAPKSRSEIWSNIKKLPKPKNEDDPKCRCNYCGAELKCHPTKHGTTSSWNHCLKEIIYSIAAIKNVVRYVRSSLARLKTFKEFVTKVGVPTRGLLTLDVLTRVEEPSRTLIHGILQCAVGFHHLFNQVPEYSTLRQNLLLLSPCLANLPKEVKMELEDPHGRSQLRTKILKNVLWVRWTEIEGNSGNKELAKSPMEMEKIKSELLKEVVELSRITAGEAQSSPIGAS